MADDGYGKLVPYVGKEGKAPEGEDPTGWDVYWYGLATTDGRVVTEPVYALVEQMWCYKGNWENERITVYQLWTEKFWESDGTRLCAVAALDGSWCTETVYLGAQAIGPDRLVLADQENRLWFGDLEGNITPTALDRPITELWENWQPDSMNIHSAVAMQTAVAPGTPETEDTWQMLRRMPRGMMPVPEGASLPKMMRPSWPFSWARRAT